jgi:hypothetical protein
MTNFFTGSRVVTRFLCFPVDAGYENKKQLPNTANLFYWSGMTIEHL